MAKKAKKEKRPVAKIDFRPYGAAIKGRRNDHILYGEAATGKSTNRRQLDTLVDDLTDTEIKILRATAQAILDARAEDKGSCAEKN